MVNSIYRPETFNSSPTVHPSPAKKPLISIRKLNHYYGKGSLKKQVLFDIDLDIYPGEIVIMTGPSGSGKTTLLTLIGALRSAQEGSLEILHQELNGATAKTRTLVRRNIGFIFQAHNLLPFMTARQNVRMALELKAWSRGKAAQLKVDEELTKVGLEKHLDAYPEKLSGGQKQRVAIARALVNQPPLILADEPTASLDSQTGREVVQLMQKLAKEQNCTILLVTHDHRILDIADRIIHMEDGRLQSQAIQAEVPLSPTYDTGASTFSLRSMAVSQVATDRADTPAIELSAPVLPAVPPFPQPLPVSPAEQSSLTGLTPITTDLLTEQATIVADLQPSQASQERTPPAQTSVLPPLDFSPPELEKTYTIACIDDSSPVLYSIYSFLDDDLFSVVLIQNPTEALEVLAKKHPDVIVLDIDMPQMDGYAVCTALRQNHQLAKTPIVFTTDQPQSFDRKRAKALGVTDCLTKPFNQADLIPKIFPYLT